ncbi:hypothetical protein AAFF_G00052970 [Aldrovandia affinis]|uniref:Uncharacterized protein n=1 Tax=Aldrovandia affinis TaxID=143900 RepID=A0AAD7T5Z8_9TELE|nr:hypothetical protein AAFF_G00052970 [Aldrovandia affinis]
MRASLTPQKQSPVQSQPIPKVTKPPEEKATDRPQRKLPRYELRIQESFEELDREEGMEELALILTDREVRVLPSREAQELSRWCGEGVQTLILQPPTPEGDGELHTPGSKPCRTCLSAAPLILLFREPMQVKEAYRHLEALLEEEEEEGALHMEGQSGGPVPKPRTARTQSSSRSLGPRVQLPSLQLGSLKEALRQGLQTGCTTLQLSISEERHSGVSARGESGRKPNFVHPGVCASTPNGSSPPQQSRAVGERARGVLAGDICSSTYRRLDSLEETIRELESTLKEISGHPSADYLFPRDVLGQPGADGSREPWDSARITGGPVPLPRTADSQAKRKPPVPPKPSAIPSTLTKVHLPYTTGDSSSGSGKVPHTSAASRLKHLQQGSPEKGRLGKAHEDFLKIQGQQQVFHF